MQGERCIPIKKKLVGYMFQRFPEFVFEGSTSQFYAFRRENDDGIYDHIIIQRDFYKGTISLVITEVTSCYNTSWKGIPWFTVGCETDIACLITGKGYYEAGTGWRRCSNHEEELPGLFAAIGADIETYVIGYFRQCHAKMNSSRYMTVMSSYLRSRFSALDEDEVASIKEYLISAAKAYSEHDKACKKSGKREAIEGVDVPFLHSTVKGWVADIQGSLKVSDLPANAEIKIRVDSLTLFSDRFHLYNVVGYIC